MAKRCCAQSGWRRIAPGFPLATNFAQNHRPHQPPGTLPFIRGDSDAPA